MINTNTRKFKGEIENYLVNSKNNFDSKINKVFSLIKFKTLLCRTNIVKRDGYHAYHLLFILIILPILKIRTVRNFCEKHWEHWSISKKDTLYRFKQNASYRWRSFIYKVNVNIFKMIELDKTSQEERYFVIDDTILQKLGRKIENVSFLFDQSKYNKNYTCHRSYHRTVIKP